jgi:protein TilB
MNNNVHPKSAPQNTSSKASEEPLVLYGPDGRVLQKNQGKWVYSFTETDEALILQVQISKFLDTSLIDVDVHPERMIVHSCNFINFIFNFCTDVRITIKGKILQLTFDTPVQPSSVICERSQLTGALAIVRNFPFRECSLILN